MEFNNLNKALQRWSKDILKSYIDKINKNTSNRNHNFKKYPKRLADSATIKIKELENFVGIYFEANKYWIFIEKGVKRRSPVDVDRQLTKLSDANWQLKPRPFLNSSIKEDRTDINKILEKAIVKDIKESMEIKLKK